MSPDEYKNCLFASEQMDEQKDRRIINSSMTSDSLPQALRM